MLRKLCLILAFVLFIIGFASSQNKVRIAVAANAQFALKSIKIQFEAETGIPIEIIVGSSGKLTAQIQEGAPFDVFLSADMKYPNRLYKNGFTEGKPAIYGYGSLVLWGLKAQDLPKDLEALSYLSYKKLAIANPKTAPYGRAAIEALQHYKIFDQLNSRLVYGESISQVSQFIITGNAELGITAKSIVLSPQMEGKGKWIEIDQRAYEPIAQGVVIVKQEKAKKETLIFYNYLFSEKARKILKEFGYSFKN